MGGISRAVWQIGYWALVVALISAVAWMLGLALAKGVALLCMMVSAAMLVLLVVLDVTGLSI